MKINHIVNETTTSGSVATVDSPIGATQSRGNPSIYGGKKVGSMFKGKKTSKPFANSLNEAAMKDLAYDLQNMKPAEFQKKYGKSREEMKAAMSKQPQPAVNEAELQEDDIIMVPGQGKRLKPGFIAKAEDRTDHEVEMARSDLFSAAQNAQKVFAMIKDMSEEEGLDGWVQEKIIKANDYLNTIREYLEGKQLQHESKFGSGVIGNGAMGEGYESSANYAEQLAQKVFNVRPSLASEDDVLNIGYKIAVQDLASQTRAVSLFRRDQDFPSDFVSAYRFLQKRRGVTENNQRGDSLVTDALKIMRGSEVSDAVRALTTVLGNREYNSRRGFYNFYIRQMIDAYGKQGMTEGAKVDRMVKHIEKSEKKLGKSKDEAENIAWATANKRGMLNNKNKKA